MTPEKLEQLNDMKDRIEKAKTLLQVLNSLISEQKKDFPYHDFRQGSLITTVSYNPLDLSMPENIYEGNDENEILLFESISTREDFSKTPKVKPYIRLIRKKIYEEQRKFNEA